MKTTREQLREIMLERDLTRPAVAELLGVANVTVDSWLAPPEAKLHIVMPNHRLDYLKLALGMAKRPKPRARQKPGPKVGSKRKPVDIA